MHKNAHIIIKVTFSMLVWVSLNSHVQASDEDDFSALFEDLFSGEDNPFLEMFNHAAEADAAKAEQKKDTTNIIVVPMPTKERLEFFNVKIQNVLTPLAALIKNIHFNHNILGGSVYERIQHQRTPMTALESTLLHLQSLEKLLPAKEIEPFIIVLEKEGPPIVKLLNEILTQTYRPASTNIDDENSFILGKTNKSPIFMPTAQRRKLEAKINTLSSKLDPLNTAIQKNLSSPEFKKLFPEIPTPPKKTYAPTSSSGKYSGPSQRQSATNGSTTPYNDNYYDPYDSNYSSDYLFDEYGNPIGLDAENTLNTASNQVSAQNNSTQSPFIPHESPRQPEPKGNFVELVSRLQDNETMTALQEIATSESMLNDPDYFARMATTYEVLFKQSADGGLREIAQLFKSIEKEKLSVEKNEKTALETEHEQHLQPSREQHKMTHTTKHTKKTKDEEKEAAAQEAEIALNAARSSYDQNKQATVKALVRLLYIPVEQNVVEQPISRNLKPQKPILTMMLPEHESLNKRTAHRGSISQNALDLEDDFCRASKKAIVQFITLLEKKFGLKSNIDAQKKQLSSEIDQFESSRNSAIKELAATLNSTHIREESLPVLLSTLSALTAYANELHYKSPTTKTYETHFYKISTEKKAAQEKKKLSTNELKALKKGHGTTRWDVTQALNGLKSKLKMYNESTRNPEESPEVPDGLQELELALLQTSNAWAPNMIIKPESSYPEPEEINPAPGPRIVERSDTAENANDEQSQPISPEALKRLMEAIGGNLHPKRLD